MTVQVLSSCFDSLNNQIPNKAENFIAAVFLSVRAGGHSRLNVVSTSPPLRSSVTSLQ